MSIPTKRDPSLAPVACEKCGTMTTVGESHSFTVAFCYATTGVPGMACFQCPAEQHFGCSQECAVALAHACIDQHMVPLHQQHSAAIAAATPVEPTEQKGT